MGRAGEWLAGLLWAVQFLTVAPPLLRRAPQGKELGRAVGWFPLVGLALGALLAGAHRVLEEMGAGPLLSGALVVTLGVLATGALHLDGLMDTCDALFGGRTREERLRILRDERVGVFGAVGGALSLLLKTAALAEAPQPRLALLLAPVLARGGMAAAVVLSPYARPQGLGRAFKEGAGPADLAWASLLTALPLAGAGALTGRPDLPLSALASALLVGGAVALLARRLLGGFTGDLYGALAEAVETGVLVGLALPGV